MATATAPKPGRAADLPTNGSSPAAWSDTWTFETWQKLLAPFETRDLGFLPKSPNNGKALAMAYIDARAVGRRLDEAVGPHNWSFDAKPLTADCKKFLISLTILGVTRCDVGEAASETEPAKAALSDGLKRAAVHFGVGRYLYSLPKIWASYDSTKKRWTETPAVGKAQLEAALRRAGYTFGVAPVIEQPHSSPDDVPTGDESDAPDPAGSEPADDNWTDPFLDKPPAVAAPATPPTAAPAPAPAPAPTAAAMTCSECQSALTEAQHAGSTSRFGVSLCPPCFKKDPAKWKAREAALKAPPTSEDEEEAAPPPDAPDMPAQRREQALPTATAASDGPYEGDEEIPEGTKAAIRSPELLGNEVRFIAQGMTALVKKHGPEARTAAQMRAFAVNNEGHPDDKKIHELSKLPARVSHRGRMWSQTKLWQHIFDGVDRDIESGELKLKAKT